MKAFLASCVTAIVLAVAAHFILDGLGFTAANTFSSGNVRL